jgi:hypothetical protein
MIRRSQRAGLEAINRFVLFDPMAMLVSPDCHPIAAVEAFQTAEKKFRKMGYYLPGVQYFLRKFIFEHKKTFITIQVANAYHSSLTIKEVPENRGRRNWIRKLDAAGARRIRDAKGRPGESPGPAGDGGQDPYTSWKDGDFIHSGKVGDDHIPENVLNMIQENIQRILDVGDCFDLILSRTNAEGIKSVSSAGFCGWREESHVTPPFATGTDCRKATILS